MIRVLKQLVVGTALEPFARRLHARLRLLNPATRTQLALAEQNRAYDAQTSAVMARVLRPDSNCIDIGCHQGAILREMLELAPRGKHFAFEPLPDFFSELVKNFGDHPGVELHSTALSSTCGQSTFQHVISNPGYSGLRKRRYDRPHEEIQEIVVKTDRLDNVLPPDIPIHFMKVDVEGAELQVFQGARETLTRHWPVIVFEHGLGGADYYGTRPEDVFDLLVGSCGMKLSLMIDWLDHGSDSSLSKDAFCAQLYGRKNYYFIAHP